MQTRGNVSLGGVEIKGTYPRYVGRALVAACEAARLAWNNPEYFEFGGSGRITRTGDDEYERTITFKFHFGRVVYVDVFGRQGTNTEGDTKMEWQIDEVRLEEPSVGTNISSSYLLATLKATEQRREGGKTRIVYKMIDWVPQSAPPTDGYAYKRPG